MLAVICCLLHVTQAIHPELLSWSEGWKPFTSSTSHNRKSLFNTLNLFPQEEKKKKKSLIHLSPLAPLSVLDCIMKNVF